MSKQTWPQRRARLARLVGIEEGLPVDEDGDAWVLDDYVWNNRALGRTRALSSLRRWRSLMFSSKRRMLLRSIGSDSATETLIRWAPWPRASSVSCVSVVHPLCAPLMRAQGRGGAL